MDFFLLLFLSVQTGRRPGRWAMFLWGAPLGVIRWEQIPGLRLRAPFFTCASMTPYSLIGREAEAARTHHFATSVGLLVFMSNLNGYGQKEG